METIQDTNTRLTTFISESYPNVDLAPGSVLNELIIKLASTIQQPLKNDIDALAQVNTITSALNSTEDTFSEVISGIASNYGVVRNTGAKSTGKLKITLNGSDTIFVNEGTVFNQPVVKLNYLTSQTYRVTTNPQTDRDIKLIQKSAGSSLYYFVLPVQAEEVGAEYQLTDKTSLALTVQDSISGFVDAKAYGNFTTGLPVETDKELITRFKNGLSHKTLLSKTSILSKLQELYPNLTDLSVVGAADPEMTRSKQNILGISTLGAVDVYLRTSIGLETTTITKEATKTDEGKWSLSLNYQDVPGFYRVISILPSEQELTGSLLHTITFDYNNSGFTTTNLVNNKYEARFSKYQTADIVIDFEETDYELPASVIGGTTSFDILVSYQPNIGDIQNLFLDPNERILCADYLVKGMTPCFVSVGVTLERNDTYTAFPVDKLKQDIYKYINNLKIGEDLQASKIVDICHNYNVKKVRLPIKLSGEIFTNHSTTVAISSKDTLSIPTNYSLGISKKTTGFISNYFNSGVDPDSNLTDTINIEVL